MVKPVNYNRYKQLFTPKPLLNSYETTQLLEKLLHHGDSIM